MQKFAWGEFWDGAPIGPVLIIFISDVESCRGLVVGDNLVFDARIANCEIEPTNNGSDWLVFNATIMDAPLDNSVITRFAGIVSQLNFYYVLWFSNIFQKRNLISPARLTRTSQWMLESTLTSISFSSTLIRTSDILMSQWTSSTRLISQLPHSK